MQRACVVMVLLHLWCVSEAMAQQQQWRTRPAGASQSQDGSVPLKPTDKDTEELSRLERNASLYEAQLGPNHPDVARTLGMLANAYARLGQYEKAEPLYRRALGILEATVGPNHRDVSATLGNLGILYEALGQYTKAEPLLRRALSIDEAVAQQAPLDLAAALNNLANLYKAQGRYAMAGPLYERALAIREATLGPNHPEVAALLHNLANLYEDQGLYTKLEPLRVRVLAIQEAAYGPQHPAVATALEGLALLYQHRAQYAKAEPLLERVVAIRKAAFGEFHSSTADSLNNLALLYQAEGEYKRAEPLYRRSLEIREAIFGKRHLRVALALGNLAGVLADLGQYDQAETLYKQALEIREATFGGNHPEVADTLHNLALLQQDQGHYAAAERLLQRALEIRKEALGERHPEFASSLNSLANAYKEQGLYTQAEPLYRRVLELREALYGPNHPDFAASLINLGLLYQDQGFYSRAEPLLERALQIQETVLGKDHPKVATALNNLARLYADQALYARAEPMYQRALAIREAALGEHHPDVAASLNNLAVLYQAQGDYARAESLYWRAIELEEAALGQSHPQLANALNNLANLYTDQGQYAQAEPLFERALAIREATRGRNHPDVASSLNNLANLYNARGDVSRAEPYYLRALEIWESLGKNHPDVALPLLNLAGFYRVRGLYARAEPLGLRGLAIQEATLGKDHPRVAAGLTELALLRLAQQRIDEALPLLERAFTISEQHLRREVLGFSEPRLASILQLVHAEEEHLYSLARAHPDNARVRALALSAALLRKGRSVEELSSISRIVSLSLNREDLQTFERLRSLRTQLSTLSLDGPGRLTLEVYQQRLQKLRDEGDALEAALAQRSAPLRALSALPPPAEILRSVAATLPKNGALIEIAAYRDTPLVPGHVTLPWEEHAPLRYLALLLFADGQTSAVDLGLAGPIDQATRRFHDALADQSTSYQLAARELYTLVFRPLQPLLGDARRLFLSPDGQLAVVPFAALHDGRRFLADAFDITYLTSGEDLLPRPGDIPAARSVVVLADPDFGSPPVETAPAAVATPEAALASLQHFFSARRSLSFDQFGPLPGTRREAEAIRRLLPSARLLLGRAASKAALLGLETPGVLHIATHGFFLEDAAAAGNARAVGTSVGSDTGPQYLPADPLLRSGLVLSGIHTPSSQPGSRRYEDFLVTALELAGLNLWGTQLVVLSACDTGRGDVKLGQGVYGMRRALAVAGAETLVTSLWKVNDETTRQLMATYYRNLLAGQGRTAALRQAMQALRKSQSHPHFWAPFIAIGRDEPLLELER